MNSGYGKAYGAVSILNAIATGIGAALGIELGVEVRVKKADEMKIMSVVRGVKSNLDNRLVSHILSIFRRRYSLSDNLQILIKSEIPPEKGLKSSSAVANALIRALFDLQGMECGPKEILKLNVEASKESGVSITGALDDAAASLLGGLVITDNKKNQIIRKWNIEKKNVLIAYPNFSLKTSSLANRNFSVLKPYISLLTRHLLDGDWKRTAFLNGIIYSTFLGYDATPLYIALEKGAETAGLSGTGPALFTISNDLDIIKKEWQKLANLNFIETYTR